MINRFKLFREHPAVLKQAISVGRRLQDPLVEFSQLCNPENDILCLRYHPMQVGGWGVELMKRLEKGGGVK